MTQQLSDARQAVQSSMQQVNAALGSEGNFFLSHSFSCFTSDLFRRLLFWSLLQLSYSEQNNSCNNDEAAKYQ